MRNKVGYFSHPSVFANVANNTITITSVNLYLALLCCFTSSIVSPHVINIFLCHTSLFSFSIPDSFIKKLLFPFINSYFCSGIVPAKDTQKRTCSIPIAERLPLYS